MKNVCVCLEGGGGWRESRLCALLFKFGLVTSLIGVIIFLIIVFRRKSRILSTFVPVYFLLYVLFTPQLVRILCQNPDSLCEALFHYYLYQWYRW